MDNRTDTTTTVVWAFSAPPAEGVAALESIAQTYEHLSTIPLDDLLHHVDSHVGQDTDARELMSSLLSLQMPLPSAAQAALYVVIVSRVYIALFFETVVRKRRLFRPRERDALTDVEDSDLLLSVFTTMEAWARDLVPILVLSVLPSLHLRDAEPATVKASHAFPDPSDVSDMECGDEVRSSSTEEQMKLIDTVVAYHLRGALVRLVDTLRRTTSAKDGTVVALLLAVYAALCHTEFYSSPTEHAQRLPGSINVTPHPQRKRLLPATNTTASTSVPSQRKSLGDTQVDSDLDTALSRFLSSLRQMAAEMNFNNCSDSLSFALAALQTFGFPADPAGALHSTDVERGTVPPDCTAASLAMERDQEEEAYTLVALDALDEHSCEMIGESSWGILSDSLCRQGALLLLSDTLRHHLQGTIQQPFAYSISAASLLCGVTDAYTVALRGICSGAVLMRQLLFLRDIISAVPKYTVRCAEEAGSTRGGLSGPKGLDSCLTRRYQAFFDLAREILSISATCPLEDHRQLARMVAVELLERLEERARVRMQGSLMALCPYPSIARFFLEQLLGEWRALRGKSSDLASRENSSMHTLLPFVLQQCVQAFITQVSHGTSGFVDPLVVALNFVRVEVSQQTWLRSLCFLDGTPTLSGKEPSVHRAWHHLLRALRETLLSQCHTIIKKCGAESEGRQPTAFAVQLSLSPLDLFSLTDAVEGLEEVLR